MSKVDPELQQRVLDAINKAKYRWRTVGGVARDARVDPEVASQILLQLDNIIESRLPSKSGDRLFTTREKFTAESTLGEKALGALKNRLF